LKLRKVEFLLLNCSCRGFVAAVGSGGELATSRKQAVRTLSISEEEFNEQNFFRDDFSGRWSQEGFRWADK